VAAALAALAAAPASQAALPGIPAIYITYSQNCTFTMTVDPGTPITSAAAPGQTLPPGTYQLLTFMPNPSSGYAPCPGPAFTFTGPGVSTAITFAGAELADDRVVVLQPSSAYTAEDENAPAATKKVVSTSATGSSSSLVASSTATHSSGTSVQPDIVGSAILPYRGKLIATVDSTGKATLKLRGRAVATLKAGKYDIAVDDRDARAGFFVQRASRKPTTVTGVSFVGRRSHRVALGAGTWTFFSNVGAPVRFAVVK